MSSPLPPAPSGYALCSPDLLDALANTIDLARAAGQVLADSLPSCIVGVADALNALLDGAARNLETLQADPVNLTATTLENEVSAAHK